MSCQKCRTSLKCTSRSIDEYRSRVSKVATEDILGIRNYDQRTGTSCTSGSEERILIVTWEDTLPTLRSTKEKANRPADSHPGGAISSRRSDTLLMSFNTTSNLSSFQSFSRHKPTSQTSLLRNSSQKSTRSFGQRLQTNLHNGTRTRSKRIRPQYPLYSSEPHVEYILVASFDIDRGPIMEHQFPGAISPDENMLAELMLPDQTHVRKQDWTMFFLHKDASASEEEAAEREERRAQKRQRWLERERRRQAGVNVDGEDLSEDSSDEDSDSELDGPPLMYVLNLVNTKEDSTVRRGAVVKAMAICTRHSFLHIYKPLLLLALEDYFKSPVPDTLELLYNALNAMDLSLMPHLSLRERHLLQSNDAKDLFVEKFEKMIEQRSGDEAAGKVDRLPDSPSKPTSARHTVPRDTHEFESRVSYNGIPIPVKVPTAPCAETVGDFSLVKLVQTFGGPHQTQPQPFALHPHLTTSGAYTHPILVLINAMLTQKRVIFLGHNRPSGEVAEAVLAACALASGGVLRGFTRHAFPYTDLTKIDELLKVPGFIAGVTNPAFLYHPEWWDLLCDLPSGRMKISSGIEAAPVTEGSSFFQQHGHSLNIQKDGHDATGDTHFMDDIMRSIADRQGESIIRSKFRAYITKFARIAAAFEETVYGASSLTVLPPNEVEKPEAANGGIRHSVSSTTRLLKGHGYVWASEEAKNRELAATAARIEGWRNTRSYYAFISDLANHTRDVMSPLSPTAFSRGVSKPYLDLYHCLARLRTLRLTSTEAGAIYVALEAYCDDYNSILELLEMAPFSEAGLFHVSLGLWHEDRKIRDATAVLLDRVRKHAAGRIFFARLGGFVNAGFLRAWKDREARLLSESQQ